MTREGGGLPPAVAALRDLRDQQRQTAEQRVMAAAERLSDRTRQLADLRAQWNARLTRDGAAVASSSAGALQRQQACDQAASGARERMAASLKAAIAAVAQAQAELEEAQAQSRAAGGELRVVERYAEGRRSLARAAALRAEDEEHDELANRR